MIFTLLAQTAVGSIWAMAWLFTTLWSLVEFDVTTFRLIPIILTGICLGAGMLASLAHLGTKKNAWRVFANLKNSSLSKEVFYTGLLAVGCLLVFLSVILHKNAMFSMLLAGAAGIGLVYHMAEVYRLPAAPGWNSPRTNIGFFVSAVLLGLASMTPILAYESKASGIQIPTGQWVSIGIIILVLLLVQMILMRSMKHLPHLQRSRFGFILTCMALTAFIAFFPGVNLALLSTLLFVFVMSEEVLGRWLFYRSRI